jgi:hypothetical protein
MKKKKIDTIFEQVSKEINLKDIFYNKKIGSRAIWSVLTELLFLIAPLFIITLIMLSQNKFSFIEFCKLSDISLISTFLFGLAIIKLFQLPQDTFILDGNESITGIATLFIIFGLISSIIIFIFSFISTDISSFIIWSQPILLLISIIVYALTAFTTNSANILKYEATNRVVEKVIDKFNNE